VWRILGGRLFGNATYCHILVHLVVLIRVIFGHNSLSIASASSDQAQPPIQWVCWTASLQYMNSHFNTEDRIRKYLKH
jgi:hypothetical protein